MDSLVFTSREKAFDFLDDYARQRREEIERHRLGRDQGLIKSYLIETLPANGDPVTNVPDILRDSGWRAVPVDDTAFYRVQDNQGEIGLLESLSSRHLLLHSIKRTDHADKAVRNAVFTTARLDFAWLAGSTFQTIWQHLILPQMPRRFVTFKFEHLARFEGTLWNERDEELDEGWNVDELTERRASTLAITERADQIARFLEQLQIYHPPFKAIKMLRIPAAEERGGYDFWSWGKITYRAPSFRDGRSQILSITRLYERATQEIERRLWFQVETTTLHDGGESITLTGAPVTLIFEPPLPLSTFQNFVNTTFERGQGPLRLWGNPIYLGEQKVHIYGIDLHLWKRIYLEITPRQMIVVLPRGTCGNSVHRLVTNIQRYLTPTVKVFIGDVQYDDLIEDVFLGRINA